MESRIKENPKRTFDVVVQVACPASENEDPTVLWSFPQDHTDQEVLQTIPKFCFPFDVERVNQSQVGQNFTFVLTDIDSKQRFGFCRLTQGCRVCICLLSYLPWFEIYYKLLNTLADYLLKKQENDLNDMLNSLYDLPVPKPHMPVNLSVHSYFIAPDINGLPTIPESRNLTEYFVAVDVNNMLQLYASMLHERRIIITSSKLSTLTACVHGAAALLFPMYWQHIFIPVLPPHLLDYCCAPMPYFVGVHLSLLERVQSRSLEDVVILNVDNNTLESPFDDLHNLPSDVMSALKSKLKKQSTATGSGVARAFLRAQAALFGSYRDALRYRPGEPITFCEESFVNHRSSTMRSFLSMAVNLQLFKQFIDGRLAKLNAGRGFTDVFEEEITEGGFCGSNSRSYQQWMHTVKRGGALINTAVTKAKSHAKRGIRDIKGRLKARDERDEGVMVCAGSPTSTKSLSPRRLQKMRRQKLGQTHMNLDPRDLDDDELDTASKISSEDSGDVPSYTEDSDDSLDLDIDSSNPGQMNLLAEILDSLNTSTLEQGKLSAAKSLDFFRSMEDLDYTGPTKPTSTSLSKPVEGSSDDVSDDQGGWNMGQDDSVVHGKHLPPSPRRQPNRVTLSKPADAPPVTVVSASPPVTVVSASPPVTVVSASSPANTARVFRNQEFSSRSSSDLLSKPLPVGRAPDHRFSCSPSLFNKLTPPPPSPALSDGPRSSDTSPLPTVRSRTISEPKINNEPPEIQNQCSSTSILRRKVLSKDVVRQYQEKAQQKQSGRGPEEGEENQFKQRYSALPVPWEKEGSQRGQQDNDQSVDQSKGSGVALGREQEKDKESMSCRNSVVHTRPQLLKVQCNNSNHRSKNPNET
ncbi:DENN domain-containing protein 1B isoform X2 [Cynoglossus semilaevis]|uniref:DENN domain-containing protein 1B isoform X2 n=1 Tax=Cynoglossus semilaevis TaxID=244447 RepID=UPI00049520DA|nr:DENN domain-containing protein 1B isoform X2 [Cynoglossus semilaevis]